MISVWGKIEVYSRKRRKGGEYGGQEEEGEWGGRKDGWRNRATGSELTKGRRDEGTKGEKFGIQC